MSKKSKKKATKTKASKEHAAPKDVDAIVAKEFTSTIFGNVVVGQKITISQERFETWKASGMVKAVG